MVNKYKKIVLLSGLGTISDYNFRIVKSLLNRDLQLTEEMQNDYDRVKIADLMEEKFHSDAGLSILIELYQDIPELEDLVGKLRKKMAKVKNKIKRKAKGAMETPRQDESSTSHLISSTKEDLELEPAMTPQSSETQEDAINKSSGMVTAQSSQGDLPSTNKCSALSEVQTPPGSPTIASSSLQTILESPQTSYTILTTPQGPSAPFSSSDQTSQLSPVTATSNIPTQVTSMLSCTHQVPSGDPAFQASPATVTSEVQASQMIQTAITSSYMSPQVSVPTESSSFSTPQITPVTVLSSAQASQGTPATMISGCNDPQVSAETVSISYNTPEITPATMPSNVNPLPGSPATQPSNSSSPQSVATSAGSFSATSVSPATSLKKPRPKTVPKQPSEEVGPQSGPKQVMVLKATEPFTYDMRENKRMFHATVATEAEFFRVKVFDIDLKRIFIPNTVIVISDYSGHNGFIEIYRASSVSEVNGSNVMNISPTLRQNAREKPTISTLYTQQGGTFVNGAFIVYTKTVKDDFIYYGIEDDTGQMEVVVHGQFTRIYCEPGDELKLFCFELSPSTDMWQLRSGKHSYLQVTKAKSRGTERPNPH